MGFYVHHHGHGHLTRARTILAHLDSRAALLSSADLSRVPEDEAEKVPLPLDTDAPPVDPSGAPPLRGLHYAPLGGVGLRERTARMAAWASELRPALLVVDVSAEISVLGRLLGLPVVTVRQHGLRTDEGHLLAYGVSHSLLAPYPEELEEPSTPRWVAGRTFYSGGFCRDDARIGEAPNPGPARARTVCVLVGAGGSSLEYAAVARAAASCRDWPGWCSATFPAPGGPSRTSCTTPGPTTSSPTCFARTWWSRAGLTTPSWRSRRRANPSSASRKTAPSTSRARRGVV